MVAIIHVFSQVQYWHKSLTLYTYQNSFFLFFFRVNSSMLPFHSIEIKQLSLKYIPKFWLVFSNIGTCLGAQQYCCLWKDGFKGKRNKRIIRRIFSYYLSNSPNICGKTFMTRELLETHSPNKVNKMAIRNLQCWAINLHDLIGSPIFSIPTHSYASFSSHFPMQTKLEGIIVSCDSKLIIDSSSNFQLADSFAIRSN